MNWEVLKIHSVFEKSWNPQAHKRVRGYQGNVIKDVVEIVREGIGTIHHTIDV